MSSQPGHEFEPMAGLSRRTVFVGACLLACSGRAARAASTLSTGNDTAWERFLQETRAAALSLLRDEGRPASSYVRFLSAEAASLKDVPEAALQAIPWMEPAMWFGMLSVGTPFAVTRWRMEPGAQQPAHNHPEASVCTLVLQGELVMENFEFARGVPDTQAQAFEMRRTRVEHLTPGRTSILAPAENNIHRLTAGPRGAEGIDFNTLHRAGETFAYIDLLPTPSADVFTGRWFDPSRERTGS